MQVLKEDGRPSTAKSYLWVRRGGPPGQRVIPFDYAASRAGADGVWALTMLPHGRMASDSADRWKLDVIQVAVQKRPRQHRQAGSGDQKST